MSSAAILLRALRVKRVRVSDKVFVEIKIGYFYYSKKTYESRQKHTFRHVPSEDSYQPTHLHSSLGTFGKPRMQRFFMQISKAHIRLCGLAG